MIDEEVRVGLLINYLKALNESISKVNTLLVCHEGLLKSIQSTTKEIESLLIK